MQLFCSLYCSSCGMLTLSAANCTAAACWLSVVLPAAIFMQWCLPWLPTERISRMVLLNTALPPHILFREFGLANALLVAIWQLAVMLVGRYIQVRHAIVKALQATAASYPASPVVWCYWTSCNCVCFCCSSCAWQAYAHRVGV